MNQPRPHRSADVFPGSDTSWNRTPVAVTGAFLAKPAPATPREFQWVLAPPESAAARQMRNSLDRSSALASDAELFRQKNGANCCSLSGIDDYNSRDGDETCFSSDRPRTEDAVESCSGGRKVSQSRWGMSAAAAQVSLKTRLFHRCASLLDSSVRVGEICGSA